jgi:phenylalanyl-tRNA synthetase beta chain
MNISYQWLKDFLPLQQPADVIGKMLTSSGLEVEAIEQYEPIKGGLRGVVVGQVLTCARHPNADKLSLTTVDVGAGEPLPIVCGAPNVAAGQKVLVATVGTTLYPTSGEPLVIKKAKIRGEASEGMICAEDELGLGTSHAGIMVLDTDLPNGTPAAEYLNLATDEVFVIGLTPNRADAASHLGVARDLKAQLGLEISRPSVAKFKVESHAAPVEVVLANPQACPRYSGVSLAGVRVGPSPEWLQHRLRAIGVSPINNVVDVTNYVLHELGQPLHAFDLDKIAGQKVIVKTLPEGTPFVTLDKVERKLRATDLMICDGNEAPMCIGGVFGGLGSGITEGTTRVFLESAYFDPAHIRASSQAHGLKTDASFRFERGTDPNGTVYALQRAALLIQEVAGGQVATEIVDHYPNPIPHRQFTVKYAHIDRLIGKKIGQFQVKSILQSLDIAIVAEAEGAITVSVPPYRVDVEQTADIVEEVLRIYGFDNVDLAEQMGADYLAEFPERDDWKLKMELGRMLAGAGFSEILTNSLTKADYAAALPSVGNAADVEMLNKLSNEQAVLRQSMLFSGLEVVAHNLNRRQRDLKLFEFGKTYHKIAKEDGAKAYQEPEKLVLFVTGNQQPETWQAKTEKATFYTLAGAVQKVLQKLGTTGYQQVDGPTDELAYGLTLVLNKRPVAKLGLVKPALAKMLDIKQEVFYAELDWQYLAGKFKARNVYRDLPKYPEVRRDLSLVLDRTVTFDEIKKVALATERALLQQLNVFDVYEGANLGEGKKSYSVQFTLLDPEKTLTDEVIDRTMTKLMAAFEQQLKAVIRK